VVEVTIIRDIIIKNTAIIIITLFLVSMCASAVNTLCVTGPTSDTSHYLTHVPAIKRANDELNDYFKNGHHLRDTSGKWRSDTVATFQKYQPQHYFQMGHAMVNGNNKGRNIGVGSDRTKETLWAENWRNTNWGVQSLDGTMEHSPAPFSAIIYIACKAGYQNPNDQIMQNKEAFQDMWSWIFVGPTNSPSNLDGNRFIRVYADKVTDGKRNYWKATVEASKKYGGIALTFAWLGTSQTDLDHGSWADKYRNIKSQMGPTGIMNKNDQWSAEYVRSSTHFWGSGKKITNGAYIVFHGTLNDNKFSLQDGDFKVQVKRTISGTPYWSTYRFDDVKNTVSAWNGRLYYGRSIICTKYLPPDFIEDASKVKVFIKMDGGAASKINVDRFEIMEIGKD
jgi:hypothetical protein